MKNLLFTYCVLFSSIATAQNKPRIQIVAYTIAGINYGSKTSAIKNPFIQMYTKPTPTAGIGVQLWNKSKQQGIDVQISSATVNNYLKETSGSNMVTLSNEELGNTSKKANFFDIKLSVQQTLKITIIKKISINATIGVGARYATRRSSNIDQYRLLTNTSYKELLIASNAQFTSNSWGRTYAQLGATAYGALQFKKTNTPLAAEFFWNPALTTAVKVTYQFENPALPSAKGNAKQMLHSFGVKLLYAFTRK